MSIGDIYQRLPNDNAGSIAKNRFGYELAVGLEKLMEYYTKKDDYVVVFDYVCDIEVHCQFDEELNFYQVKTTKNTTPFSASYLTKIKKGKKNSIIGTLYKIKAKEENKNIKLAIIGNIQFKDDKILIPNTTPYPFSDMSEKTKKSIIEQLKKEKIIDDEISLEDVFYIYNPMNILTYDETMLGKLTMFYTKNIDNDVKKANVLYSTIKSTILQKASYEAEGLSYEKVICNKGITKTEFKKILDTHKEKSNNIVEKCINEYNRNNPNNLSGTIAIKRAITRIIGHNDQEALKILEKINENIEQEISQFNGGLNQFVEDYIEKYNNIFSVDDDYNEKYAYVLYEYIKMMEE